MKTFEDCCEEVAKERKHNSYLEWLEHYSTDESSIYINNYNAVDFYKQVSFLYASYKEEEAFKAGFERGKLERNDSRP